jgi:hypothetical protein
MKKDHVERRIEPILCGEQRFTVTDKISPLVRVKCLHRRSLKSEGNREGKAIDHGQLAAYSESGHPNAG